MQAGELRRRIDIQAPKETKDSTGNPIPGWNTVFRSVPCSINSIQGREYFAAQQIQSDITNRIVMRWQPGLLDTTMRAIEYTNAAKTEFTIYNIEAVLPDETGRLTYTLMCRSRLNEGFRKNG